MDRKIIKQCPFGCEPVGVPDVDTPSEMNELGYCKHLIGFTNDGRRFEVLGPPDGSGQRFVQGKNRQTVKPDDVLVPCVNPVTLAPGLSKRVYRQDAKIPTPAAQPAMAK